MFAQRVGAIYSPTVCGARVSDAMEGAKLGSAPLRRSAAEGTEVNVDRLPLRARALRSRSHIASDWEMSSTTPIRVNLPHR